MSIKDYEEKELSQMSSKSFEFDNFIGYCKSKLVYQDEMKKCDQNPRFRNNKFSKYALTRSSEDKFISKLKTFAENLHSAKESSLSKDDVDTKIQYNTKLQNFNDVIMFYGNWGKSPNLKNSMPTPGIGLRRKIHKHIKTVTVSEHFTSQTCPCCKTRTSKIGRTLEKCYRETSSTPL